MASGCVLEIPTAGAAGDGKIHAMPASDTSPAAQAMQLRVLREMSGEQRILMALEMSLFTRELAAVRIRQEHPEWQETEVAREPLRLAFLPDPLPAGLR
jgi:hypothetical protein